MSGVTVLDCALVAAQCYKSKGGVGKWRRLDEYNEPNDSFNGVAYYTEGSPEVVIAVRGTQEGQDVRDDTFMFPTISGERGRSAMQQLVELYLNGQRNSGGVENMGGLVENMLNRRGSRQAMKFANKVPTVQAKLGTKFVRQVHTLCKNKNLAVAVIAGHSLGGAIAKCLSEQSGSQGTVEVPAMPCVAFNSPNMGSMKGMRLGGGAGIMNVNCTQDPLSFLTRAAGNYSHADLGEHSLRQQKSYEPSAPAIPDEPTIPEFMKFLKWFGKAAAYYHSMAEMVNLIRKSKLGGQTLGDEATRTATRAVGSAARAMRMTTR